MNYKETEVGTPYDIHKVRKLVFALNDVSII